MQQEPADQSIFSDDPDAVVVISPRRRRVWFHGLLFALTCLTTLIVGARMQQQFDSYEPIFLNDQDFFPWRAVAADPSLLLAGIPFSASLLGILFAHEMGHFLLALRYRVYATLPYFLPAPTPIGTFGAFIQIRSRFHARAELLDIAIGGPIAGFVVALPLTIVGLLLSKPLHPDSAAWMDLGYPLIFHLVHWPMHMAGMFHGAPLDMLLLHPVAVAAWIGMLATALNLLPGGQLDGGHIVYALSPRAHRVLSLAGAAALAVAAYLLWSGWIIWAVAFVLTRRHPPLLSWSPSLPSGRRALAWMALLLLLLTIMPVPFGSGSVRDAWSEYQSHER